MQYDIAESYPEQISFRYKTGLTEALWPHKKVYAIRAKVICQTPDGAKVAKPEPLATDIKAKIADPQALTKDNVRYESHRHAIWATELRTQKVLWKTLIPMARFKRPWDPKLERAIQWNVMASLPLKGEILVVENSKGEKFVLDALSGSVLPVSFTVHKPNFDTRKFRKPDFAPHLLQKQGEEIDLSVLLDEINSSGKLTEKQAKSIAKAKHLYLNN